MEVFFGVEMLKKMFITNQFILVSIVLGLIASCNYYSINDVNKYFIGTVGNKYDVSFVNSNYIICSFDGSGGWLDGGIVSQEMLDTDRITTSELEQILNKEIRYRFPVKSFPDVSFHIRNLDFDENIEVFAFDIAGKSILHSIEIKTNGEIEEENGVISAVAVFLALFMMIPFFLFCIVFIPYYVIVFILYLCSYRISHISTSKTT